MSQKLTAILEGFKQGKWEIIEPHHLNPSYDFKVLDRLILELAPLQVEFDKLFEGDQREHDSVAHLEQFVRLDDQKTPLERKLESLTHHSPYDFTDAFEATGSGYELQAILGVYGDRSVRSCQELSTVIASKGLASGCTDLVYRTLEWYALQDKSVFENVSTIHAAMDKRAPHFVDVRDFLSFDWQKKIKRYCYVASDILKDFGDGNQYFSFDALMDYRQRDSLILAGACYRPEYSRTTYYATHLDAVGGPSFQTLLQTLKRNFNQYQKQRIIYWTSW